MAGKVSDEALFEAEKRLRRCEAIIGAMSEEERSDPDLLIQMVRLLSGHKPTVALPLLSRA